MCGCVVCFTVEGYKNPKLIVFTLRDLTYSFFVIFSKHTSVLYFGRYRAVISVPFEMWIMSLDEVLRVEEGRSVSEVIQDVLVLN